MRRIQMIIFVTIVLSIYILGNLYIFYKGYNIPALRDNRLLYGLIFFSLAFTFIAAKIFESRHSSVITDILNVIGGFWMAYLLYGFIFFFLSDVILLLLRLLKATTPENILHYKKWSFIVTVTLSSILIIGGFINAVIPTVTTYNVKINKPAGEIKSMRIAAVSDIHLGSIIRKRSMVKLSGILTDLKPDIVLLLGDIVDGEIGPVLRGDLLKYFTCPKCNEGLYAITGNHEFIGGSKHTIPYIESKGIRLLKDEMVILDGGIQLVGRLDKDSHRFSSKERLTLSELMKQIDTTKPVILLDHQPYHLNEVSKSGVDLQLSGHTHNGQMWPLNYVTKKIFELSYGYLRINNTHFIVSSGYGLWGPRVRSASKSEVLLINVEFNGLEAVEIR